MSTNDLLRENMLEDIANDARLGSGSIDGRSFQTWLRVQGLKDSSLQPARYYELRRSWQAGNRPEEAPARKVTMNRTQRAAAARHKKLAKMAEKKAEALKKAHEKEHERLNKALAAIDKKFEPKLQKLAREIAEHETKAQVHHANAAHIHHTHGK